MTMEVKHIGTVQDELLDRLDLRLRSGTLKRKDLVRRIHISQSTLNRWKLRQVKPTGVSRMSLERTLNILDKRKPIEPSKIEELTSGKQETKTKPKTKEASNAKESTVQNTETDPHLDW